MSYGWESNLFSSRVSFFILTKNEENSISQLIYLLDAEAKKLDLPNYEILVIDDSTDNTAALATEAGAVVIKGPKLGLGAAYRVGLASSLERGAHFIASMDGDGQVDVSELSQFFEKLSEGYDLVTSSRFKGLKELVSYSYPAINFAGSKILSFYLSIMTGQRITDSHGGLRLFRAEVARRMVFECNHTYVQETLIEAAEAGFKIAELPSVWNVRKFGHSRVVHSIPKYIKNVGPFLLKRFAKKILFGKSR